MACVAGRVNHAEYDRRVVPSGPIATDQSFHSPIAPRSLPPIQSSAVSPPGFMNTDWLLLIWDGSPIHSLTDVMDFVSSTRSKVWLEAMPGYAPDLNPWVEGGWHHPKHVQMRNLVCRDLEELHEQFQLLVGRLRQKPNWSVRSSPKPGWRSLKVKCFAQLSVRISLTGHP
jgi:hypothetical protein